MLSIIIPALNAAATLGSTVEALRSEAARFECTEFILVDGGSTDGTVQQAEQLQLAVIETDAGRGLQLARGAEEASQPWLLFLHADTALEAGWSAAVSDFVTQEGSADNMAAVFQFALDDTTMKARRLEQMVAWRTDVLGLPYGDQGLLISRRLYQEIGGFRPLPIMEDVDIIWRIGKKRLVELPVHAVTSAQRYQTDGFAIRSARNLLCLGLYFLGAPASLIKRIYG